MSGDEVRSKVMNYIESKDQNTASRLKNKVKSFEATIQDLPAQGIQILYRRINPMLIAQLLKASSEAVKDKFMSSLSEGAAERLKQEIELSPPLSKRRLRKEKIGLMLLLNSLIDEGTIEGVNS
jgi:flagellar motor switch protein FliG